MRTAALIIAETDKFDPTAEMCGMSPIEWLTTTFFRSGIQRVAITGSDKTMLRVTKDCTKMFLEFIINTRRKQNYIKNAAEYLKPLADRIIIAPVVSPFMDMRTVNLLINSQADAAVAVCNGKRSKIIAIDNSMLNELIVQQGDLDSLYEKAFEIECNDISVVSDVSEIDTDLSILSRNAEIHSSLQPELRITLGYEKRLFGPGTVHLFRLINERQSINKAIDTLGMHYATFMKIRDRFEEVVGTDVIYTEGETKMHRIAKLTPEASEFINKYEDYYKEVEEFATVTFNKYFGDFTGVNISE